MPPIAEHPRPRPRPDRRLKVIFAFVFAAYRRGGSPTGVSYCVGRRGNSSSKATTTLPLAGRIILIMTTRWFRSLTSSPAGGTVPTVATLMMLEAVSLAVASALHLAGMVHGRSASFDPDAAGIAEAVIGAVLAAGATRLVHRRHYGSEDRYRRKRVRSDRVPGRDQRNSQRWPCPRYRLPRDCYPSSDHGNCSPHSSQANII